MLDYSLNDNEKENFILNYEINGDEIKVNVASGDEYSVPYTKENEENIIKKMEEQISNANDFIKGCETDKETSVKMMIFCGILACACSYIFINKFSLLPFLLAIGNIYVISRCYKDYQRDKTLLKDLEKHTLFLEHKDVINKYLAKGNEKVKEESMNPVITDNNTNILTVNDVHDMNYEDITLLLDDIKRDEVLDIERPKVLTKKYINRNNKDKE